MSVSTEGPIYWCSNCLNASTRPRISFDERGWCNACLWSEEKLRLDWAPRNTELLALLDKHRRGDGRFDCIATVSGGKDGSYVAYQLKHVHGMNPLCVTIRPDLELEVGESNLRNFIARGYDHLHISPNQRAMRALNRFGLIEGGSPYFGWLTAIHTAVARVVASTGIRLVFYGEDGEVEYGGSDRTKNTARYDFAYMRSIYHEGLGPRVLDAAQLSESEKFWFTFPDESELPSEDIYLTHWSYFEAWDPYRNFLIARQHCGLYESDLSSSGTFTNFAQTDQSLYALHTFLMYLKFGFGRATQDAGIEIRRGAMTRQQGLELVRLFDGAFPFEHLEEYLEYFEMTEAEFFDRLNAFANPELFDFDGARWTPLFETR